MNKSTGGKHPVPWLADTLDGGPNPAPLGVDDFPPNSCGFHREIHPKDGTHHLLGIVWIGRISSPTLKLSTFLNYLSWKLGNLWWNYSRLFFPCELIYKKRQRTPHHSSHPTRPSPSPPASSRCRRRRWHRWHLHRWCRAARPWNWKHGRSNVNGIGAPWVARGWWRYLDDTLVDGGR